MAGFKFDLNDYKSLIRKLLRESLKEKLKDTTNIEINTTIENFLNELEEDANTEKHSNRNSQEDIAVYSTLNDKDIINSITGYIYKIRLLYSDNIDSFYDYEKLYTGLIDTQKIILELQPKRLHYEAAYNICLDDFKKNKITFNTTLFTIERIINWKYGDNNEEEILSNILNKFIIYWDNVLKTYIRPSARIKRIHYLIDRLITLKQKPFVSACPIFIQKIDALQNKYRKLTT